MCSSSHEEIEFDGPGGHEPPKKYMYAYPSGIAISEITIALVRPSSKDKTRYDRSWTEPIRNSRNDAIQQMRKFLRLWESESFDPNSLQSMSGSIYHI